jgi:catechol 2,3-dioxygenase-like lactoylglutathione lyase family enzyme
MTARRIGFVGVRIGDLDAYVRTVALYRDVLGLAVTRDDGERSTRFVLPDGTSLHLSGPADMDHVDFGERTCVGLFVDDVAAARNALAATGIELFDAIEEDDTEAWFHYRAPDGSVQEIIGPRTD